MLNNKFQDKSKKFKNKMIQMLKLKIELPH